MKVFPKTQVMINAAPFHMSFRRFLSPKVAAFWRLTISFNWGWRHLPGVPDTAEGVAAIGVAFGVDGRNCAAICREWEQKEEKGVVTKNKKTILYLRVSEATSENREELTTITKA